MSKTENNVSCNVIRDEKQSLFTNVLKLKPVGLGMAKKAKRKAHNA